MPLYKTKGIALKSYKLGEADKIIILISPEQGKVRAVAKGIRKTKSKFGSRLEPFTYVDMLLYEGRELDIITQAEIITSFKEIRGDLDKLKYGSVMLELMDKVSQERQEARQAFQLFLTALKTLAAAAGGYRLLLAMFELKLMSAIGFRPQLDKCVACPLSQESADRLPSTVFSLKYGGFLCAGCKGRDPAGIIVGTEVRRALNEALATPLPDWRVVSLKPAAEEELFRLAERYVSYHLDRALKSARMLDL